MKSRKNNSGFTLMETMVYIALFGIIMSGAVVGTYNLLEGGRRNIDSTKIEEEGTFLNRKINWALTSATGASVSGGGTILTISRPDMGAQSPLVISQTGNKMTISRGTGVAVDLNNDRFQVSDVVFTYTAPLNGRPGSVSSSYKIAGKNFNFRNYLRQ